MKLISKRLRIKSLYKFYGGCVGGGVSDNKECCHVAIIKETKWEMRPGGMLVQKRDHDMEDHKTEKEGSIMVRVEIGSQCCDISIHATSTFGELKMMFAKMTGMETHEQRVLFKGKEREDMEQLHMVGVIEKDKVVIMLKHPDIKESKVHGTRTIYKN